MPRPTAEGDITRRRRNHHAATIIVCGLSLALTITAYFFLAALAYNQAREQLQADAGERLQAIDYQFRQHATILDALVAFYAGSTAVERDEFQAFTAPLLRQYPATTSLQWVPVVPGIRRTAHEHRVRTELDTRPPGAAYSMLEPGQGDQFVAAKTRARHLPIEFAEPSTVTGLPLGFDWSAIPAAGAAFANVDTNAEIRATTYRLEGRGPAYDMLLVAAEIHANPGPETPRDAAPELTGFVAGTFDIAAVIDRALQLLRPIGLDIEWQIPGRDDRVVALRANSRAPDVRPPASGRLSVSGTVAVADQTLSLRCVATPEYLRAHTSWAPMTTLLGGLVITLLLGGYLFTLAGRTAQIEQLVKKRTLDLETANTDLLESRKQLRVAVDAAESANNAKSEFLANMSHEIRTPLNGVIGLTELMLRGELTTEQREHQTMVKHSADALLFLINDILDFSKIEAGKLELERRQFSLREAITGAVQTLAYQASQKRLELACRIGNDLPDELVGDAGRLRQIIVNLTGNAVKFTEQGEVVVSVSRQSVSDDRVRLHVYVRDTGIGIAPEKREGIFQAFTQADASMSRRFGGTGLGLAISGQLAKMMNGRMWVESEEEAGSTFHFTAEFSLASDAQRDPPWREHPDLRGLRVLAVDDNETHRTILQEMVRSWDMEVEAAADGVEALELVAQATAEGRSFDVVLLDVVMPRMDGFAVAHELRQRGESARLILLSGVLDPQEEDRAEVLGAAQYLTKPIKHSELLDAIADAIGDEPATDPGNSKDARYAGRSLHVLLAEDGEVNQTVAIRLLELRGHRVTLARNGREAIELLREREDVDVVLMDIQMPEMDGLEATRAIRLAEADSGGHIPIIAMTAHAMKGDRERCITAGMDDYIAKPLDVDRLYATIESEVGAAVNSSAGRAFEPTTAAVLDWDRARKTVGGSDELLAELVATFLNEAPKLIAAMRTAIDASNAVDLHRAAHTMKGSAQLFAAAPTASAAGELETLGNSGRIDGAEPLFDELRRCTAALSTELKRRVADK